MTGITMSYLITEEVGDSGSWLKDPDNWDDADFDNGTEYAQFKVIQQVISRDNDFNITVMPFASAFAFPTEERVVRVTFQAVFDNLADAEKLVELWIRHTRFDDNDLYLIILDSPTGGNTYYRFWDDDDRGANKYVKGKLLKIDQPFQARDGSYRVNGQFQGVWD